MKLTGENRSTRRETCHSTTLSTTNPTWTDPGSNPGLRCERPATNRLSHGTVCILLCMKLCCLAEILQKISEQDLVVKNNYSLLCN
jgi:hypothetical protein